MNRRDLLRALVAAPIAAAAAKIGFAAPSVNNMQSQLADWSGGYRDPAFTFIEDPNVGLWLTAQGAGIVSIRSVRDAFGVDQ